ncbi:MAG: glycosyltransferase [Chloroflexota bacterium]
MAAKIRILLYSHDTYGLGHLRRSLTIAGQLAQDIPHSHQLLLTGSMLAGAFQLPPRLDMIKLPALSKRSSGAYKARTLPLTLRQTISWREQMILQAAQAFRPDLLLVDKSPAGVHGELLPTLRHLKTWSPQTKIVLGMRDIEDSPAKTQAEWAAGGIYPLLEEVYDRILLYGEPDIFDPATAYWLPETAVSKLTPCGYLGRPHPTTDPARVRRELSLSDGQPLIVLTVGGGGDGYSIIQQYLDMLRSQQQPLAHTLIVTGPLMAQSKRKLLQQAAALPNLTLREFTPDLMSYLAAADLVVSMAGYNTVCEILSLGKRALLIPRSHVRAEQQMRATLLAERGLVHTLNSREATPDRLHHAITTALAAPAPTATLNLNGLQRVSAEIGRLLTQPAMPSNEQTVLVNEFYQS